MNDRADIYLLYSIIENILRTAETPAGFGNYLSEQIKSLIGVVTVSVYSYDEVDEHFVNLGVCPTRNSDFAKQPELQMLLQNFVGETRNLYLEMNPDSPYKKEFQELNLDNILIMPLTIAEHFEGLILLCNVFDNHNIKNIIETFTRISSLAAIVLRNSKLYNNLEKNVKKRTEELQKKNEEYRRIYKDMLIAKETAEENERYLLKLIKKSPLPMVITDENQDIELFNTKFTKLFGYTTQDVRKAERWWQIFYPDENYRNLVKNSWNTAFENAIENNTDVGMQIWDMTTKKGEERTCEFYMVPLGKKNLLIINDITEQRRDRVRLNRAKNEAEQAQILFNSFMKHAPIYAYIENEKHEQIYHNHRVWNLFNDKNYNPFSTNELFDDKQSEILRVASGKILKRESQYEEVEFSTTFDDKLKEEIWVKDIIFPIQMPNGRVLLGGIAIDVTQEKLVKEGLLQHQSQLEKLVKLRTRELEELNENLRRANIALNIQKTELQNTLENLHKTQTQLIQSEKMASLGILVAGVAHEINNPVNFINSSLTGIKNNLEYLSAYLKSYREPDIKSEQGLDEIKIKGKEANLDDILEMFKRSVEIIEIGIQRTTKIVKSLRSFARSDEKELSRYNIHENIDNTLLILYNQYKNHIEVKKNYNTIPLITCYPGQINQVVMNVLTNAIHAIKEKGTITITTENIDKQTIAIIIEDDGEGISSEVLGHIFDPFYTTKAVGKGTGLGLSISYNIIKEHKGEIHVNSTKGKGSCFKIILPITQNKPT
ncbi:MAG: PAS domain S-box protein [Chloroflexia bacterium]|nr:PAS domain S-box protein [Chloroflexia bacterium]